MKKDTKKKNINMYSFSNNNRIHIIKLDLMRENSFIKKYYVSFSAYFFQNQYIRRLVQITQNIQDKIIYEIEINSKKSK